MRKERQCNLTILYSESPTVKRIGLDDLVDIYSSKSEKCKVV